MKKIFRFAILLTLILTSSGSYGQINVDMTVPGTRPASYAMMEMVVEQGDTIYLDNLRVLYVYPPLVFKSGRQEKFYWRTVRDVKKALPYARLATIEIMNLNRELYYMPNDAARKKHISDFQSRIFRQYEKPLRNLTINQGKMLIKLIDREHDMNTFDIIKAYKGNMPAFFWTGACSIAENRAGHLK